MMRAVRGQGTLLSGPGTLLLLTACVGHGLEPASEDLLRGTWGSASNGLSAVLVATDRGVSFRAGCVRYHVAGPLRLTRDRTFSGAAR